MKKVIFMVCLLIFIGCKSKKVVNKKIDITEEINEEVVEEIKEEPVKEVKFIKLTISKVNNSQKQKAYELGKRILLTCNTSKFKPFNESEATRSVINNITIEKLSTICTRYRQYYGTFIDLRLKEVYRNTKESTTIYRYKALYTKKVANKELRVYMNDQNQVSAIKTMDWFDVFEKK